MTMTNPDLPDFTALSLVDRAYFEGIFKMSGTERVVRSCSLFDSIKRMLSHQIHLKHPDLSERELRIRVAERMYCAEPETLKLLKKMRHS
jgi:hypothetical protein